ncbi:MAG: NHLP bacteriocin export ABC transporter permease/ATPase subunit [Defluviitaleaceae bacterium]|nr:NHLP bacteriocin export ABC transporter permease/ATPase subunit [Defluviitaleaceae bacterium]
MGILHKKDNLPFWPHAESGAFFMLEGTINIYYSKIAEDGSTLGARIFLFQMLEGELFLPMQPLTREDGVTVGILAVPARDSEINQTQPTLSPIIRPYVDEWVEKCCRRIGYSREQTENTCQELDNTEIDELNSKLLRLIDSKVEQEFNDELDANRRRYAGENSYMQRALESLSSVVPGTKTAEAPPTAGMEDELIAACAAVAHSIGVQISIPRAMLEGRFSGNPVESIAHSSRFRTREVLLSDKWYKQDGGSFLAYKENGDPVALIQKTPRKYLMYDPATGTRKKVTARLAAGLNPKAVMFYRSMPMRALTGKDIFRFVMQGTKRADWVWVFIMGLCGGLLAMLSPEITGKVFDTVIPDGNRNMLVQIGFLMAAVALTSFAFEVTRAFSMLRITGAAERDVQSAAWDRMLSLPVGFFKDYTAGELAERAMSISQILNTLSGAVINTIITSIFSVFYIIVMFTKSVKLTWVGLAITAVVLIVSLVLCWRQIKHEGRFLEINNLISGRMFGWLSGIAKIKMSGAEKRVFYNRSQMFKESRAITYRKESIANWSTAFNSMVPVLSSIVIYACMFYLEDARMGTGAFIAFNAALGSIIQNAVQLSHAVMSANVVGPLYKAARPIFDAVPEYDELKSEAPVLSGDIKLSRINFSYSADQPKVIKDVSLSIRSGEHVALVGPSGSGKSTLFRILLAFEQPNSGDIYFDGTSISNLDVRSVRRQLGVVLQSGQLLAGSIFENIAGTNPDITHADAMEAVRKAGMEEDLKQMPMGLHTMISEGVGTLSGGQRQRILIARALAGNPKVLFFDEATSALDNKTQKIVSDSVNQLKITRITIAHRLSTIMDCDRIVVLENGRITEEGKYQELMKLNGTFAAMARRQMI